MNFMIYVSNLVLLILLIVKWKNAMMGYAYNYAGGRHAMHREFGVKDLGRPRRCWDIIKV
jgi:hypothetical protein